MLEKFQSIENKFNDIERRMSDPEIISDQKKYQELIKQHAHLKEGVDLFRGYKKAIENIAESKELLNDPEMADLVHEEIESLNDEKNKIEFQLKLFLIPKNPEDSKNAIVEIRSGTGGNEAALFAAVLYRMYKKYAEINKWKVEIIDENSTELGGIKEVSFSINGSNVFEKLKYESGTHRVQRVPETEASGRIHTSAATVAILPEADEVDVEIDIKDCRVDTYRSSGAGGQHVNKTDSAVRITHLPSGIVCACQDERSQTQNKEKALRLLRSRLYEKKLEEQHKAHSENRKLQVGSGDRSQKIRTYNYPQGRVTDHRINLTIHNLDAVLEGRLTEIIDALIQADQMEKMSA
jgi:peptide chain release factor 1